MHIVVSIFAGLVFGIGIMVSGMASPAKVMNFFDVAGTWDPSLMFVMCGALVTTLIGYQLIFRRRRPISDPSFHLPTKSDIDVRLVSGAAIFGIGWGIAGFCPGGAIPAIGTGRTEVLVFSGALIAGILITRLALQLGQPPKQSSSTA